MQSMSFNQLMFPKKRGVEVCEREKKVGVRGREGRREGKRQGKREDWRSEWMEGKGRGEREGGWEGGGREGVKK